MTEFPGLILFGCAIALFLIRKIMRSLNQSEIRTSAVVFFMVFGFVSLLTWKSSRPIHVNPYVHLKILTCQDCPR